MMRRVIAAAALAAAVTCTAQAAAQPARAAAVTRHPIVVFGANAGRYQDFHHLVPAASFARVYDHAINGIPFTWPAAAPHVVLSIEATPSALLSGSLNRALRHLAMSAPPGSFLTIWYESGPANPRHYPAYVTAAHVRAELTYANRLLRGTDILVGSLVCGPVPQLAAWIPKGLGWYGVDVAGGWFRKAGRFEWERLHIRMRNNTAIWNRLNPHAWHVVGETNTRHDQNRAAWFRGLTTDLASMGPKTAILSFWAEAGRARQGAQAGIWPPGSKSVATFRELGARYPVTRLWTSWSRA